MFKETIEVLHSKGATVVEDIHIPSFHREWSWGVSLYELKHSLDNYLSKLPSTIPVHSISELMEFNENIAERALKYGQTKLERRKDFPNTLRNPEYLNARLEDIYFSQEQGIDFALEKYNLDHDSVPFLYRLHYMCKSRLSVYSNTCGIYGKQETFWNYSCQYCV